MAKASTKSAPATSTITPADLPASRPNPTLANPTLPNPTPANPTPANPPSHSTLPQSVPPPSSNAGNPVHAIRYGAIRSSIWRTESPQGVSFTVTIDRFWVDKAGEQTSQTFRAGDLQHLAKTAIESRCWIEWQERRLAESRNGPP